MGDGVLPILNAIDFFIVSGLIVYYGFFFLVFIFICFGTANLCKFAYSTTIFFRDLYLALRYTLPPHRHLVEPSGSKPRNPSEIRKIKKIYYPEVDGFMKLGDKFCPATLMCVKEEHWLKTEEDDEVFSHISMECEVRGRVFTVCKVGEDIEFVDCRKSRFEMTVYKDEKFCEPYAIPPNLTSLGRCYLTFNIVLSDEGWKDFNEKETWDGKLSCFVLNVEGVSYKDLEKQAPELLRVEKPTLANRFLSLISKQ